jgi:endogenous inhibitor of DNA gyrase (YacG/DUF329 family)
MQIFQPCDYCGEPVEVHALSPSECFCSAQCCEDSAEDDYRGADAD